MSVVPVEVHGKPRLDALVAVAMLLGIVGFGGGYAIAARIRRALVEDRRWLEEEAFVEALSVASSLPGTTATNLLALIGYRLAGTTGALAAAVAFLTPSVVAMIAVGVYYDRLRSLDALGLVLDGMGAATAGVVAAAAVHLRGMAKGRLGWALAAAAGVLLATRTLALLEVVTISGLVGALLLRPAPSGGGRPSAPPADRASLLLAPAAGVAVPALSELFSVFARIGIATFGGGVAMIAPMQHEVVTVHAWLSERAFSDAIVLGQITPGPIAIAATFIGYRVAGAGGAALATLGIFGPPFVLSVVAARSMPAFRTNAVLRGVLAGIAPAVVGVIGAASLALGQASIRDPLGGALAATALALLVVRPKLSPLLPIATAGALTLLLRAR